MSKDVKTFFIIFSAVVVGGMVLTKINPRG
jgi:hypothetical protein